MAENEQAQMSAADHAAKLEAEGHAAMSRKNLLDAQLSIVAFIRKILDMIYQTQEAFKERYPNWKKDKGGKAFKTGKMLEETSKNLAKMAEHIDSASENNLATAALENGYDIAVKLENDVENLKGEGHEAEDEATLDQMITHLKELDKVNFMLKSNMVDGKLKNALKDAVSQKIKNADTLDFDSMITNAQVYTAENGVFLMMKDSSDNSYAFECKLDPNEKPDKKTKDLRISYQPNYEVKSVDGSNYICDNSDTAIKQKVIKCDYSTRNVGTYANSFYILESVQLAVANINKLDYKPSKEYEKSYMTAVMFGSKDSPSIDKNNGNSISYLDTETKQMKVYDESLKKLLVFTADDKGKCVGTMYNADSVYADVSTLGEGTPFFELNNDYYEKVEKGIDLKENPPTVRYNANIPLGDFAVQNLLRNANVPVYFQTLGVSRGTYEQILAASESAKQWTPEQSTLLTNKRAINSFINDVRKGVYAVCKEDRIIDIERGTRFEECMTQTPDGTNVNFLAPNGSEFRITINNDGVPENLQYKDSTSKEYQPLYDFTKSAYVGDRHNNDRFVQPFLKGAVERGYNVHFLGAPAPEISDKEAAKGVEPVKPKKYEQSKADAEVDR